MENLLDRRLLDDSTPSHSSSPGRQYLNPVLREISRQFPSSRGIGSTGSCMMISHVSMRQENE